VWPRNHFLLWLSFGWGDPAFVMSPLGPFLFVVIFLRMRFWKDRPVLGCPLCQALFLDRWGCFESFRRSLSKTWVLTLLCETWMVPGVHGVSMVLWFFPLLPNPPLLGFFGFFCLFFFPCFTDFLFFFRRCLSGLFRRRKLVETLECW